jgi:hypothetical protein
MVHNAFGSRNDLRSLPIERFSYKWEYDMHAVTLKWLPIVIVSLIQSQRLATVTAKYITAQLASLPIHTKSALSDNMYINI